MSEKLPAPDSRVPQDRGIHVAITEAEPPRSVRRPMGSEPILGDAARQARKDALATLQRPTRERVRVWALIVAMIAAAVRVLLEVFRPRGS